MKKFFRFSLLLTLCLQFNNYELIAQPTSGGAMRNVREASLSGLVVDHAGGKPMEYANIVIYSLRDSSMVGGGITGNDGRFHLKELPYGRFYVTVDFIGYEKLTLDSIFLRPNHKHRDLGKIELSVAGEVLEGVEVTADRPMIDYQVDKKVVLVSKDLAAIGGSAVDVLENTPSVTVDIEGNISLRGSDNFTVLIDGRPTPLSGTDALRSMPANAIHSIELITNPTAKYDPDGVSGIINIVTKKDFRSGLNGLVSATYGSNNNYSSDLNLNYRLKKLNFNLSADYRNSPTPGSGLKERDTYLDDITLYNRTNADFMHERNGWNVKGGIDYTPIESTTLSIMGRIGEYESLRYFDNHLTEWSSEADNDTSYSINESHTRREGVYYNTTVALRHKFNNNPDHNLDFSFYYAQRDGDDLKPQREYISNSLWEETELYGLFIDMTEADNSAEYRTKLDYTRPFNSDGKLEAGYQWRYDDDLEYQEFRALDTASGQWIDNPNYTGDMIMKRQIHGTYITFAYHLKSLEYKLGLRTEYTDRQVSYQAENQGDTIHRFDIFPTIHLAYKFGKGHQLQASYSRRINRPRSWWLDPSPMFIDRDNIRHGSMDLMPEYIDSYEMGYQKTIDKSMIALESYYRITNNAWQRTNQPWEDDSTVMVTMPHNMDQDEALGAELMLNLNLVKWMGINLSSNYYYYAIKGQLGEEYIDRSSMNWNMRSNLTFKFTPTTRWQVNFFYHGPTATAQGSREAMYGFSTAVKQEFFKRKLGLTFNVRDVFGTMQFENYTETPSYYIHENFHRDTPTFSINVSYRINNYRQQDRNGEGSSGEGGDFDGGF